MKRVCVLQELGMRAPAGLTAEAIANAVGQAERVQPIDCETQSLGPRMTLAEWARYFTDSGPKRQRQPLLNVVSLSLAGTSLQVKRYALNTALRACIISMVDFVESCAW